VKELLQELSYRKQIARQLRRQYVEDIYRPKYYTVTLKSRLRVKSLEQIKTGIVKLGLSCNSEYRRVMALGTIGREATFAENPP